MSLLLQMEKNTKALCAVFIQVLPEGGGNPGWHDLHKKYKIFPKALLWCYSTSLNRKSTFLACETGGGIFTLLLQQKHCCRGRESWQAWKRELINILKTDLETVSSQKHQQPGLMRLWHPLCLWCCYSHMYSYRK